MQRLGQSMPGVFEKEQRGHCDHKQNKEESRRDGLEKQWGRIT